MPELLIELLTEEIPARMQARAAEDLARLLEQALNRVSLQNGDARPFHGPRRIGLTCKVGSATASGISEQRGPRHGSPANVIEAFVRSRVEQPYGLGEGFAKDTATKVTQGQAVTVLGNDAPGSEPTKIVIDWQDTPKGRFLLIATEQPATPAEVLLQRILPELLWAFPWPKSMRWGVSQFTWVRPLQRILCLLDGKVVPVRLARGEDDAHGLVAADVTEGHRVHAPGAFPVTSYADYVKRLRADRVIVDAGERMALIRDGVAALAAAKGLEVVPDEGLLAEVAGLVEWPVPLLGRIDDAFMDLPPEVMRTSMRVNQRYFALRYPDGRAAPFFALVANISASDGGTALVAGNERVLRARLSDARFFWDQDRKQKLEDFLPKLEGVVFHAKLGTQAQRVERIAKLAAHLAPMVGADPALAERAARLAKADLASGMVGEFPELQGVMGGYYARLQGEDARVANAIAQHYRPLGPTDEVPAEPVAVAVALADKLDQLAGFFAVDERPTGSGDPFALRRAALGIIRILRENGLRVALRGVFAHHLGEAVLPSIGGAALAELEAAREEYKARTGSYPLNPAVAFTAITQEQLTALREFIAERLRVQLRAEGARHDIIAASLFGDDDILRILARAEALKALVESEDGTNLLAAYKRAQNILRIEEKKDGPHAGPVDEALLTLPQEQALNAALAAAETAVAQALTAENFPAAMATLATLRAPVDAFFEQTMVNDADPSLRRNRLRLLSRLRTAMDQVADLSKIES